MSDAPQWIKDAAEEVCCALLSRTFHNRPVAEFSEVIQRHFLASIPPGAQALAERIAFDAYAAMDHISGEDDENAIRDVIAAEFAPLLADREKLRMQLAEVERVVKAADAAMNAGKEINVAAFSDMFFIAVFAGGTTANDEGFGYTLLEALTALVDLPGAEQNKQGDTT